MNTKTATVLSRLALVAALTAVSGLASAVTVNLTAQRMSATLPDGATVPMWGYCATPAGGACASAWAPGPTIVVVAGDTLTINLTNALPVPTSIVILGQLGGGLGTPTTMASNAHAPQTDTTWPGPGVAASGATFSPPAQNARVMSFGTEVPGNGVAPVALNWNNLKPGTYLYETGTLPSLQAPMGLYGVVIVTKAPTASEPGQAYPSAVPNANQVAYDADASLLFSEIDPVQNAAVDKAAAAGAPLQRRFDDKACTAIAPCYPAAVNYTPTYFLINGRAFDKSAPQNSAIAIAGTNAAPGPHSTGGKLLVRLLNAGSRTHIPSIVGLPMALVAEDGNVAPGLPKLQNEVLLTAGKTHDVLVTPVPVTSTAAAYSPAIFPLFDRQLSLTSGNQPDGGMQGFLQVASSGATSGAGALPTAVLPTAVPDSFQVPLNASINGNVKSNDIAVGAVALVTGPTQGIVSLQADGTFVYTPNANAVGTDTFTYLGNPGATPTNTTTVTLNIGSSGTGAKPVAVADSYNSTIATKFSVARPGVLANDSDPGGYPLTAVLAANGTCASVTLSADGSFSATPTGPATSCAFTYTARNSQGTDSTPAQVAVSFLPTGMVNGLNVKVISPAQPKTASAAAVAQSEVTDYRWIIQEDLTFKVDPTGTPSISARTLGTSFHKSHMPVVATGCVGPLSCGSGQATRTDSTTVNANGSLGARGTLSVADALAKQVLPSAAALDPAKHYYISVLPGDAAGAGNGVSGHGMGGAEIKPGMAVAQTQITIATNAYAWVPAQLSIYIYEDNAPVNGQNDLNEGGLGGFNVILVDAVGRSGDPAGQQTYDSYGMPLSNALLGRPGCPDDQNTVTNTTATTATGNKIGVIYTCPNAPVRTPPAVVVPSTPAYQAALAAYRAQLAQDAIDFSLVGHALVLNITPARYDVIAHPAAARQGAGEIWWQTQTLEGTPAQDAFAGVKEPVYFQEFGPPGFHTVIGFVNPNRVNKSAADNNLTGTATITGKITNQRMSRPSDVTLFDSGSYDLLSATNCQVALNSQGGTGAAIAAAPCDKNGNFTLANIPAGSYELMIWDQWLDQIIQAKALIVPPTANAIVALGNIPVLSWFTQYDQNIFLDTNQNGVYDPGEKGISNVVMTTRYRDGGISNRTMTDSTGNGILAELFPLFNWYVTEADTTRFKQSGVHITVDGGGAADTTGAGTGIYSSKYPDGTTSSRIELPGKTSYGLQGFISQRSTIHWGRTPYITNENGGIQGLVVYSSTRAFDDQRYNVQAIWEPLVPRVTVNLYSKTTLADGTKTLTLVDTTLTSSFDDFVNKVDATGKQVNLQCPGQLTTDPFFLYTLAGTDQGRCYDGWHNWNQVQAAPYDGRYNFPSAAYIAAHPLTLAQTSAGQTLVSLPPADYVVESVTPPGYDVVKEEDKNLLNGDSFVQPAVTQFGGLTNVFILPDQATLNNANPYSPVNADGTQFNSTSNLGATASHAVFPECVGNLHRVPDYLSLFPQGGLIAPFAGMDRPLCDRKLVKLGDQMQVAVNFFVFTAVPMAAAGAGIVLDDASSEFNAAAPDFGEKASVPFVPVSVKDFNGREISRHYTDQWGAYNLMAPSSWFVNPPTPSGYGPNMLVTCINDPGPILDATGKLVADPQYTPAYSNFCYTLPFMPGRTTYLDTPVLPIAAHASGYNPADCSYPEKTPAIARVDSSAGFGPYVAATGAGNSLTITALGDQQVLNPSYGGPFALTGPSSLRLVTRHYGFGTPQGTVTVNGIAQTVTAWSDTSITVTVPTGTTTGQLVVTAADGGTSIDTVTVTVGGTVPPTRVDGATGGLIQAAIDAANPGDLILVNAGVYNELVVMWQPVRLQGVGAASVIINAAKYPTSKLETWRPMINSLFSVDITTGNQVGIAQVDPLPTQQITGGIVLLEPSVLGTEQGPGIAVLAKNLPKAQCTGGAVSTYGKPVTNSNFLCAASRIDGLSVTGGDAGGGIYVNGWAHGLEISNNRVFGNAGALNGGVRIGVPYLELAVLPTNADNNVVGLGYDRDVKIHHNAITKNGSVEATTGAGGAGGGISICSGTDGYMVDHNWVCGNYSASDGGGIGHIGFSQDGTIANNQILFNQSFQQTGSTHGGGIIVVGEPPVAGVVTLGTGSVTIDSNVLRGNSADGGHGGGIRLQQVNGADVALHPVNTRKWFKATVINNMIENNLAGYSGGGIAMADTLVSVLDNNTIASNDAVNIAGASLANGPAISGTGRPSPAGISSEPTSVQLAALIGRSTLNATQKAISAPELANNIVWKNRSFFYKVVAGKATLCSSNNVADASGTTCNQLQDQPTTGFCPNTSAGAPAYWDLGVLGDTTTAPGDVNHLSPIYSVLTSTTGYNPTTTLATVNLIGASLVANSTTVNVSTVVAHGFTAGNNVVIAGSSVGGYNGSFTIVATPTTTTFTVVNTALNLPASTLRGTATSTQPQPPPNNIASDPLLADMYCNGARTTPEYPSVINPPAPKNMLVAATLDEGNNYVNVRFGPLYLAKPTDVSGTNRVPFGDYHIAFASPAKDNGVTVPGIKKDIDGDARPQGSAFDIGADEVPVPADLSITNTDGVTTVKPGDVVTYTIVASNAGPNGVIGATVADKVPPTKLTGVTWTCLATSGSACGAASGSGNNILTTVNLISGGSATFSVTATVVATATGKVTNTATIAAATITDPNLANNSATDTDTIIVPPFPGPGLLDNFNRADANTLNFGGNWSQAVAAVGGAAAIQVSTGQASDPLAAGAAYWSAGFAAKQAAAFTFVGAPANGAALVLRASGGTVISSPVNFIRVSLSGTGVAVDTTTNSGGTFTSAGSLLPAIFAAGDIMTAMAAANGVVSVWKTTGTGTTYLGSLTPIGTWTGGGRIGMQLPVNARVDNFAGGTVP